MPQSCALVAVMSLAFTAQLLIVLYYSKLKLRHRYVLVTVLSFLSVTVGCYFVLSCSGIIKFNRNQATISNRLLRHPRNAKPEVRELLLENDQMSHNTVHLKKHEMPFNTSLVKRVAIKNQTSLKYKFLNGIENTNIEPSSIHKQKADNFKHKQAVIDSLGLLIWEKLQRSIYNNVTETVITFNRYLRIAQKCFQNQDDLITHFADDVINKGVGGWGLIENDLPLTPEGTLERFGSFLTCWEKMEILSYPEIYFIGIGANKTLPDGNNIKENFGFDELTNIRRTSGGKYKEVIGDQIAYRYEILEFLGGGAYGNVIKAFDHKIKRYVAIKIIGNENDWRDEFIWREMGMLLKIENESSRKTYFPIVHSHFMFRNHKCIVMELLGESIHRRHRNSQPVRDMNLIKRFTRDILNGVVDLHQMNIIHGDLKPDNIMFMPGKNNHSKGGQLLKVADFGLACIRNSKTFWCPDYYIQTRIYRSPEVIMGLSYGVAIDMWSVGVIVAELYNGYPMFWGKNEPDQLASMMEVLGLLPTFMIQPSRRKDVYQAALRSVTEAGFRRIPFSKPLDKVALLNAPRDFADFIKKCLIYDPGRRITAKEALNHPFVK